ncbi:MAG: hypothetical protein Q8O00_06200 [Holophaga sp.]|nr:hypothetical protein [Holophaga sp.]
MILLRFILPALFISGLVAQEPTWLGTWKLVSSPDIAGAVEQCTAEMSFIKRPIARSRLKKLNPAYQRVVLTRSHAEISLQFEDRQPIRVPANGKAIAWTREDGEKFMVSAKPSIDTLVQHYQGEDGERENRLRVDATGKNLTIEVVVKSQKLPKPLTYTLSYVR